MLQISVNKTVVGSVDLELKCPEPPSRGKEEPVHVGDLL